MMKRVSFIGLITAVIFSVAVPVAMAQRGENTTFTGTVISYGSGFNTRTRTSTFTLNLTGVTTSDQIQSSLSTLRDDGQSALLKALSKYDLGRFSVGASVGRPINAVLVSDVDGKRRIFAIFERWINFGELRGGYRSVDYPFSVIELFIDPRTGKGDGTLIEAAQIRWKDDSKSGSQVEIENFATWPAKLMGVTQRGGRL